MSVKDVKLGLTVFEYFENLAAVSKMRLIVTLAFVLFLIGPTWGQTDVATNVDDVQKGHALAIKLCGICHVAAPDQPYKPRMKPPVPSFASIIRKKTFDAESLASFLTTTHRGLDNPKGMPNLDLMDFQVNQIVAYFLSLQNQLRATH